MAVQQPQVFQTLAPFMPAGSSLNAAIANGFKNSSDAITALAGGGAAGSPLLCYGVNKISVAATGNDSVMLPPSVPGATVFLSNLGVASAQVFANSISSLPSGVLDTINGTPGATGVAVGNGKTAIFMCSLAGAWFGPVALA